MQVLVNGVRLFFDVEGASLVPDGRTMREKPTLVLLHGGPGFDHSIYKPTFSALADIAQAVFLDHRGNGRSDPGPREAWTLDHVRAGDQPQDRQNHGSDGPSVPSEACGPGDPVGPVRPDPGRYVASDRYGHLMPQLHQAEAQKLDQLVFGQEAALPARHQLRAVRLGRPARGSKTGAVVAGRLGRKMGAAI